MRILGIESSCDETAVAIYDRDAGLLAHVIHSQIDLHAVYGGVVPELASRDHIRKLPKLVAEALNDANCAAADIDAIAFTAGPGLIGAVLVGASFAKALAYGWGVPAVPVHHMEGHLLAPMLEDEGPDYPFVALLVSGGHTLLARVDGLGDYQILGQSLDDAAGEAFDKTAKLMGLPYPGGPVLAKLAEQGDAKAFALTKPMVNKPNLDFSFSGLKTQVVNLARKLKAEHEVIPEQMKADLAASFQATVVDTLCIKSERALKQTGLNTLVVAGGVGANQSLRQQLKARVTKLGGQVFYPRSEFCTDNGAMIAYAGFERLQHMGTAGAAELQTDLRIPARPRWPMKELSHG